MVLLFSWLVNLLTLLNFSLRQNYSKVVVFLCRPDVTVRFRINFRLIT